MNVPNHEKKAFRDMTPEERSAIVEALISGGLEVNLGDGWKEYPSIHALYAYRTRPRQLVIPWEHIKPEYKWAAMDKSGCVAFFIQKPTTMGGEWVSGSYARISALNIDTAGIDWRESLTARPEGV